MTDLHRHNDQNLTPHSSRDYSYENPFPTLHLPQHPNPCLLSGYSDDRVESYQPMLLCLPPNCQLTLSDLAWKLSSPRSPANLLDPHLRENQLFPSPCALHLQCHKPLCLSLCTSGFSPTGLWLGRKGLIFCLFSLASYRMPGTKQTVWRCLLNEWTIIITSHIPSIQTLRLSSEHGVPSLTLFDKEKKKSNPSAIQ